MRDVWGRVADVTGTITRQASTGQPISIRDITQVDTIDEGDPLGFRQARGAFHIGEPAEQAVRRIRDAARKTPYPTRMSDPNRMAHPATRISSPRYIGFRV